MQLLKMSTRSLTSAPRLLLKQRNQLMRAARLQSAYRIRPLLLQSSSAPSSLVGQMRFMSTPSPVSTPTPPSTIAKRPSDLTEGEGAVWELLESKFAPTELTVRDISGGCGSMYEVDIASEQFRGHMPLRQNRMVNAALGDMIKEWHGVRVRTRVP